MTKKPGKGGGPKKPALPPVEFDAADNRRAASNVAKIRERLAEAMDDPQKREQIVRAMRSLMQEDEK